MAKASKKKVSKKVFKKYSEVTVNSTALKPGVVYDDDDADEDLKRADENITSEEEDGEDERKRQNLLEAISALGGKRRKTLGERSEAAMQMSEFMVNTVDEGEKVELSDLIQIMENTSTVPAKTNKQLKNLQRSKKTIESPLTKQESERIQRGVAFQKAATDVSRWKSIISQNQRIEQLVFPLNQEPSGPKPMERVVTGWRAQTPLEHEIFALLSTNKQPINDPILTPTEEASMRAMSLEEAKVRRAELQKARALQSYYEAQARREKKIKSKKFHKVQNKAKRKEFLKQFDEMAKTNPAAALEELNKMKLARIQERMSLKHQNSGKWAKSKAIMAKYNEGARKAMQQQLEVNKDLTQKLVTSLNNDEEQEEAGDLELLPDFLNDVEQEMDSSNPWMRGRLSEDPTEEENNDTVGLTTEQSGGVGSIAEEEVEETEVNVILSGFDSKRKLHQALETDTAAVMSVDEEEEEEESKAATEDEDASDKEEERLSEFTNLICEIVGSHSRVEAAGHASCTDTSTELEAGVVRIRSLGHVELLTQENSTTDKVHVEAQKPLATENLPSTTQKAGRSRKRKENIQLKEGLTKETKVMKVLLTPTSEDSEESEEKLDQRGLIKEAFAGDDVISEFLKDKRKQQNIGTPKVLNLTLPGWGEWGGTGLKPSSKRRKFRVKNAPPPPRKDQHLPSVIISEKRNSFISLHQVNSLPFPFENHMQFESTIRSPLGRTWNTERTVKKITKPKVVTQLGTIIEPMAQEELVKVKVSA